MPVFEFTARNLKGDLVQDKIDLPTRDDDRFDGVFDAPAFAARRFGRRWGAWS